ncbi:MAG: ribosome biogenesis GTPase Der [Candidatus Altimarinota bacterium]
MLPRITIIGRPNVGKSSLFNALSGHRIAIVSDIENTTRDIIEYKMNDEVRDISYILADSGGIVEADDETLLSDVRARVDDAIKTSNVILFVLEYDRVTEWDERVARRLRKSGKPIIVVANKADNPKRDIESYTLLELGLGEVIPTSPMQSRGLDKLQDAMVSELRKLGFTGHVENDDHLEGMLKLAIIGRPNVGKSSLVNAISGETRAIVKDMPGTTRDAIDTIITHNEQEICLIDTAGIRRAGKIGSGNIEDWSVMRAERSIERSDVIAIVIDAFEGVTHQDEVIVGKAIEAKKGIVLVFNKWDKVLAKPGINASTILDRYMNYLSKKFDFLSYAPVVFTQAIEGKRIELVLDHALKIQEERQKRVKTAVFNKFLEQISYDHAPTGNKKSHKPKIFYGSQVDVNPPRFVISVNNADHFHFSYLRYIENRIRDTFGFEGTPIEIEMKSRKSMFKAGEKGGLAEEYFPEGREKGNEHGVKKDKKSK